MTIKRIIRRLLSPRVWKYPWPCCNLLGASRAHQAWSPDLAIKKAKKPAKSVTANGSGKLEVQLWISPNTCMDVSHLKLRGVGPGPSSSRALCSRLGGSWQLEGLPQTGGGPPDLLPWCCFSGCYRNYESIIPTGRPWRWGGGGTTQKETATAFLESCGGVYVFANQIQLSTVN